MFTLTNNIKKESIYCYQSQIEYIRRIINVKNNKIIKEIEKSIELLCSIRNESFVKYYDLFIDNKNTNKIVLLIEPYLPIHAHDLKFTGIDDILNAFEKSCRGLKEYHDKNISHGNININNFALINGKEIKLGEINYDQLILDNIVDKKKDIWDLGILLFEMCCLMKKIHEEYNKDILDKVINDTYLRLLISSILKEKKEELPEIKDILDIYLPKYYENKKRNENNHSIINALSIFDLSFGDNCEKISEQDIGQNEGKKFEEKLSEKNEVNKNFEKEKNECLKKEEKEPEGDKMSLETFEEDKIIQEEMQVQKAPSLGLIEEDENEEFDSDIKEMLKGKGRKGFKNKNQSKDEENKEILNEFIEETIKNDNNKNFKKCLVVKPKKYSSFHKKLNVPLNYENIFEQITYYKPGMNIVVDGNILDENILIDEKMEFTEQILNIPICLCVCLESRWTLCQTVALKCTSPLLRVFTSIKNLKEHIREKDHNKYKAILNASFYNSWIFINFEGTAEFYYIKIIRINYRTIEGIGDVKKIEKKNKKKKSK